jgi:galactokinase
MPAEMPSVALLSLLLVGAAPAPALAEPESCESSHGSSELDALVATARSAFSSTFEREEDDDAAGPVAVAFAPGRVNMIGEHTDYSGGYVLPIALELGTVAVGRRSRDGVSRVHSVDIGGGPVVFTVADPPDPGGSGWARYVHGVLAQYTDVVEASLSGETATAAAAAAGRWGVEVVMASTVPLGSGLSSSASLEVAVATLVEELFGVGSPTVTPAGKARRCQLAEHVYAGVPCGMMDQLASVAGTADHAVLIDTRAVAAGVAAGQPPETAAVVAADADANVDADAIPGVRLVPLADPAVRVVVIDSHERHALSDGEEPWYPQRVAQCAAAVAAIINATAATAGSRSRGSTEAKAPPPIATLRDCTLDMLQAAHAATAAAAAGGAEAGTAYPTWYRRARHVISENQRALDGAEALRNRDWDLFGELMVASHSSLREDYEVTTTKLDWLSAEASKLDGVYGARMTGAGFGGCVVALVREEAVGALSAHIREGYEARFGVVPSLFVTRAGAGARVLLQSASESTASGTGSGTAATAAAAGGGGGGMVDPARSELIGGRR